MSKVIEPRANTEFEIGRRASGGLALAARIIEWTTLVVIVGLIFWPVVMNVVRLLRSIVEK